uniref:Uncharacterized protein n=1 Tax=Megaselia scalaris TaxID=36166 RepID=T1GRX2_MEGSC
MKNTTCFITYSTVSSETFNSVLKTANQLTNKPKKFSNTILALAMLWGGGFCFHRDRTVVEILGIILDSSERDLPSLLIKVSPLAI